MSDRQPLILALDFGGTKHAAGALSWGERQWHKRQSVLSPPQAGASVDLQIMRSLARKVLQGAQPDAIGVSFGGPVDASTGIVRLSHHVPGWENTPLKQQLETEFNAPVSVDNDANVAALGEHRFGAGQGYNSLLYITISTGVGGGWILNQQLWHGADGMAGEIGHTVVDPTGPECLCGKRGCVERLASGPYIAQQARELLKLQPHRGQILRQLVNDNLHAINAALVSQAASQGDGLAQEVLQEAAWALGVALGNAANLINPYCFILGGGVMKSGKAFFEKIKRVARETALPEVYLEILPAALGDEAPLWGAVALAEDLLTKTPSAQVHKTSNNLP